MKKLTLSVMVFAGLSLVLTGCPKNEGSSSEAPPVPPTSAKEMGGSAVPKAPAAPTDAAAVTAALKAADPALSSVSVAIDDKAIKLTGTVASNAIKKKAGDAAMTVAGGKKVINQLLVK